MVREASTEAEAWIFTVDHVVTGDVDPLVNTAVVDGTDLAGSPVESAGDTHSTDVSNPAIEITVTPGVDSVPEGGDVTYTVTVTNSGDTPLTEVVVVAENASPCDLTIESLGVGDTVEYTCTVTAIYASPDLPVVTTVTVTGTDPLGQPVVDDDATTVAVIPTPVEEPAAMISGVSWHDADGDGSIDGDEEILPGVVVVLRAADGTDTSVEVDERGEYVITDVAPGDYTIEFMPPVVETADGSPDTGGFRATTLSTRAITLEAGDHRMIDVGFERLSADDLGAISGTLWIDVDQDGEIDDWEPRLEAATVALGQAAPPTASLLSVDVVIPGLSDDAPGRSGDAPGRSGDAPGRSGDAPGRQGDGPPRGPRDLSTPLAVPVGDGGGFEVDALLPGRYELVVTERPLGLVVSYESDGVLDEQANVVVEPGAVAYQNVGYIGTGLIDQLHWVDTDEDGEIDENEPRLDGIGVEVTWDGLDGLFGTDDDVVQLTTTGSCSGCAAGRIRFEGLPPGRYRLDTVDESVDQSLTLVIDPDGSPDGGVDGIVDVGVDPDDQVSGIDLGYRPSASQATNESDAGPTTNDETPVDTAPTTAPTATTTPTPAPTSTPAATPEPPGVLALTGAASRGTIGLGLALVVSGFGLLGASHLRRRPAR